MSDNQTLFDDPTIAAEERELFGDQLRPERMNFDAQGDYLHGFFRGVERNVDLKTGFAPVDIWTIEGVSGVQKSGTQRIRKGVLYAVAVMHATLKNRLAEVTPEPNEGERIAIRRDRDFVSNVEGPSYGKTLVAYQVVLPDRAALGDEPEPAKGNGKAKS
jgi:hypothetical protein